MRRPNNRMFNDNAFKLGIFSANCSGGMAATKVPERWVNSWENNLKIAQMADDAGIEFMLPIARFSGYGGESNFHGGVLETITWAAGLLAATKGITCFATVHTAFTHPVMAAKQFATIDQIGQGRFGLNIVAGWNQPEYEMFGMELAADHSTRYEFGKEWFDVIRKVWTSDEPFDFNGKYFNLKHVSGDPKPWGGTLPPVLNAASSDEGRAFAVNNVDFLFTVLIDPEKGAADVASVKAKAKEAGRDVGVFTTSYVVCRPTKKEAEEYHDYYANEMADWEAADRLMELQGLHAKSFPPEAFKMFRQRFAAGHGVYPLVGDPDTIVNEMERIHNAGFQGTTLAFVDYAKEFPFFRDEVLPRLERKGLRQPVREAVPAE